MEAESGLVTASEAEALSEAPVATEIGDAYPAAAGYYQGRESVRGHGELPETEQYVSGVLAQQASFAGE